MNRLDTQQDVFTDFSTLDKIRSKGRENSAEGIKEVAKKFESMFVHMMLKSMREASKGFEEGNFTNSFESSHHRDMYDQQLALSLTTGRGVGIADIMAKQLMAQYGLEDPAVNQVNNPMGGLQEDLGIQVASISNSYGNLGQKGIVQDKLSDPNASATPTIQKIEAIIEKSESDQKDQKGEAARSLFDSFDIKKNLGTNSRIELQNTAIQSPTEFVDRLYPAAVDAAEKLGVDPKVLVAQAALETGWGKHISQHQDGKSSFNLFNIKADHRWQGSEVRKETLEYRQGQPLRETATFRSYDSYQHSFNDYVDFIQSSPRYQDALNDSENATQYIQGLQKGGYATDPEYANKVIRIMKGEFLNGYQEDRAQRASNSVSGMQADIKTVGGRNVTDG